MPLSGALVAVDEHAAPRSATQESKHREGEGKLRTARVLRRMPGARKPPPLVAQRSARYVLSVPKVPRPSALPILSFADVGDGPRLDVSRLTADHPVFAHAPHGHGFFEMMYVVRGRGTHRVGAAQVPVRPGDLYVIPPGEAHDARRMRGSEGYMVLFTADALRPGQSDAEAFVALPGEVLLLSFLKPLRALGGRIRVPPALRSALVGHIEALLEELATRKLGWIEAARARLGLVLVEAARLAAPMLGRVTAAHRPLVGDVFRFIEARYARPITLVDVARAVGKSPAYLTDVVRRETGRTVGGWIIERRMVEARRRLVETEAPLGEIAEALGYEDESYFARRFRQLHGVSPSAFRARER